MFAAEAECLSLGNTYVFVLGQCYYAEITNLYSIANDSIENCRDKFGPNGFGRLFEPKDMFTSNAVVRVVSTTYSGKFKVIINYRFLTTETNFKALYIRCGRVMADNIAYAKFRKTLLI